MIKLILAIAAAAAVLTTGPLATPAKAENSKVAQGVDVQLGRDRDRDRRRDDSDDSDVTVGVGPGGVRVGPRHNCRMVTTTVERDDGRSITRRERRCD
jgi:Ni/Co efflux regulator RcnB